MLQAIDLTKRYEDGNLALDALNLEIKPGEIFFLLGANGAGKTTSINIFLNFIEPTSGHALIAIIKDADNIVMDEPTTGLDPKSAAELMQILINLRNAGKSILMCTHDLFRAKAVADRVGIMKEGRLVMLRSREEFLQDDLERIYLDYMQEAILE